MAKVAEATVRLSLEDKLTGGLKRIQARFKAFSKDLGFNRIAASTKNLTKSLQGLNKGFNQSMGRVGKLTALLGLGGGGLAASIVWVEQEHSTGCDGAWRCIKTIGHWRG